MKKLKPHDKLAAELQRIIKEAQQVLAEYQAAVSKNKKRRPVVVIDPRNGKKFKKRKRA